MPTILQKYIAESGFCSRRQAEELIRNKRVFVNGKIAELGMRAGDDDDVKIRGKHIGLAKEKIYIKLNKPKGYVCTNAKFREEKSVFDLVNIKERLFVVGRLDKDSRGLVILTNDGDWANRMAHPRYEHEKNYELRITNYEPGREKEIIDKFKNGINIGEGDGIVYAKNIRHLGRNKFEVILTEGKKRQIRRMFKAVGLEVVDLVRTRMENIKLGNLAEGKWEKIKIEIK